MYDVRTSPTVGVGGKQVIDAYSIKNMGVFGEN